MAKMHIVTGKLGGGKSLYCIKKAKDYLWEGRKVATNLDIDLSNLMGKRSKCKTLMRLPDHPSAQNIRDIGQAYKGKYDESKTGALILDECAVWLNARDWNAQGRRDFLDVLVHIRKLRWDCYFIIQDVSMLDKQLRKILAEHVVIVRRLDRVSVPIISMVARLGGIETVLPKAHIAQIFYGDHQGASMVKMETFLGRGLYDAYDTGQIFDSRKDTMYSVIPPLNLNVLKNVKWSPKKIMQLTKIYLKKYSKIVVAVAGCFLGSLMTGYFAYSDNAGLIETLEANKERIEELETSKPAPIIEIDKTAKTAKKIEKKPVASIAERYRIIGYMKIGDNTTVYTLIDRKTEQEITSELIASMGFKIQDRGFCSALAINKATSSIERLTCM